MSILNFGSSPVNHSETSFRYTGLIASMWTRSISSVFTDFGSAGSSWYSCSGSGKNPLIIWKNWGQSARLVGSMIRALPSSFLSFQSFVAFSNAALMLSPRLVTSLARVTACWNGMEVTVASTR